MIYSFRHSGLSAFFSEVEKQQVDTEHAKRLRRVLTMLNSSTSMESLNFPGLRIRPLSGKKNGHYAVSVWDNWWITFRFKDGNLYDVDYRTFAVEAM